MNISFLCGSWRHRSHFLNSWLGELWRGLCRSKIWLCRSFWRQNVKNSWPYTQFWVDIINEMSNQDHICSFSNKLKMRWIWIKQGHIASWRNSGAGVMSSVRGFGGLAAWCPLPTSPVRGQDIGHGVSMVAVVGHITQTCLAPALASWKTSLCRVICCVLCHHVSQQALSLMPQQEKTSSFKKSKDHVDLCWCLWSKDLMLPSLLRRCVPISLLSVRKSNIFTPFWDILYISFHMCALTCLWKSKYNFIKFFAWVRS